MVLTELENAALSHDGKWLATLERRDDKITSLEMRLKFWMYVYAIFVPGCVSREYGREKMVS